MVYHAHSSSDELESNRVDTKGHHAQLSTPKKPHNNSSHQSSFLLWVLVDGIGLSLIAACTFLEGMLLWNSYFHDYWDSNSLSIIFWVTGRSFQIIGLLFLIVFAITLLTYPNIEKIGMLFLTIGPILNMVASQLFEARNVNDDDMGLFTLEWLT